jgi:hypothetical protein
LGEITRKAPVRLATLTNEQLTAEFNRLCALDATPALNVQLAYLYDELRRRNIEATPPKYEGYNVVRPEKRVWVTPSYWL